MLRLKINNVNIDFNYFHLVAQATDPICLNIVINCPQNKFIDEILNLHQCDLIQVNEYLLTENIIINGYYDNISGEYKMFGEEQ